MTGEVKMYVDWVKIYQQSAVTQTPEVFSDPANNINPSGTPWPVPGQIEAEHFNFGGEGVAYHDVDTDNHNSKYRQTESVEMESCTTYGGSGYNIGWINAGEWWKYTINVQEAGSYRFSANASSTNGGSFTVRIGESNPVTVNVNTGNYNTYHLTQATALLDLQAGEQVMTVTSNGGHNLDYYLLEKVNGSRINEVSNSVETHYDRSTKNLYVTNFSGRIKIMDLSGYTLINKIIALNESIDVNHLSNGIYIIKTENKSTTFIKN
jgi:hypothetical protein